ncbi:glutamate ABC transporter substrate-binding protein [Actinacidiphila yeochonensis]|uniref:glutamate ABC transporter substrate-binding protein n=1 Tax=Actinacidiphila yeochonensis TaxID=89050 RepID=UPI00055E321D|nr:glutamate ABC transporter substrate-binding protein [Actinacidiphila yeochonensis]
MAERTGRARRRPLRPAGPRGWGGVTAMAAACALALAALVWPLDSGAAARPGATAPAPGSIPPVTAATASTAAPSGAVRAEPAASPSPGPDGTYVLPDQQGCDPSYPSLDPAGGTTDGPAVEKIRRAGLLTVGVDQSSYLWGFRDPITGQLAGFDIDIVRAIAKDILGDPDKVRYVVVSTKGRQSAVADHEVDMVVRTTTIDCQRVRQMAFSTPYFEAGQQVLTPKNSGITGFNDTLRGRTVCVANGSTAQELIGKDRQGARVITVDNQLDCLVRVQLGQADAVITDDALAAGQAAQDPAVHLVGHRLTTETYGVAMNLDAPDLVRRVNQVLAAYCSGGAQSAWEKSYAKWLAPHLPESEEPPKPTYK